MSKKSRSWRPAYKASMALCGYLTEGDCTMRGVERRWHETFDAVLRLLGPFPKKARRCLWDGLVAGNWERIHLSYDERAQSPRHWLEELRWEVWYCSDRWSIDRLTRRHWLYRAYCFACRRQEEGPGD